jgi:hypothetical protein
MSVHVIYVIFYEMLVEGGFRLASTWKVAPNFSDELLCILSIKCKKGTGIMSSHLSIFSPRDRRNYQII